MEDKLNYALEDGEELLWEGRPEEFDTLDKTHKSGIIKGAIIKVIVGAAILIGYFAVAGRNGAGVKGGLVAIIILIAAYAVASPFIHANTLRRKIGYAITNKRLFVVKDDVKSVAFDQIKAAAIKTDDDGHVTLLCGEDAVKGKQTRWRSDASLGIRMDADNSECSSAVWYAIPDAQKVEPILRQYLPL